MAITFCPECDSPVQFHSRPFEGQRVACPVCAASLEVISVKPLELDWAYDAPKDEWNLEFDMLEERKSWTREVSAGE